MHHIEGKNLCFFMFFRAALPDLFKIICQSKIRRVRKQHRHWNKNTNSLQILLETKCFVGQFYINMFSVRNFICRMRVRGFVTSPHPSTSSPRMFFSSTFASFKSSDLCLSTCFFRWQDLNWLQKNAFLWSVHLKKKGGKSERFKPKRNIVQKKMKN